MEIDAVDPALRAAVRRVGTVPVPDGVLLRAALRTALAVVPLPKAKCVRVSRVTDGAVRLRVHRPEKVRTDAALLWIHGGGLVIGSPRQDDPLCSGTAADLGMQVFAVRYGLAPEHCFPAALDDVTAGWDWLLDNAGRLGIDPRRIAIGGESAGGGLAAALVQRIHDRAGTQPVAQWLFAPMLDDRTAARRELDDVNHWVWNNAANRFGWTSYLGQEPGRPDVPDYAVPSRRRDLAGLPPTYLAWGDIELFAEEDALYAARLRDAGVAVEVDIVAGGPHGFENWARESGPARALLARARRWLAARIARDEQDGTASK